MKMFKEKSALRTTAKKAVSVAACFCLAASLFAVGGCAPAEGDIDGEVTPMASTDEGTTGSESESTSSSDVLTIVAGAAKKGKTSGNATEYTFPDLEVKSTSTKLIKSITVQFTTKIETGDSITLTTAEGFTLYAGNKTGNGSVNANGAGATAAQWQEYLRKHLTVNLAGSGLKGLRMIASFEQVDRTLDYNSLNGHYYEYVHVPGAKTTDQTVSWIEAYEASAKASYMGMTGYLVTVTSADEMKFITSLVNNRTWLGGSCWPEFTGDPTSHPLSSGSGKQVKYYWVTGPEKGTLFASGAAGSSVKAVNGQYTYFSGSEPNNCKDIGVTRLNGGAEQDYGEMFVHMYENGTWNDYPNRPNSGSHYVQGYIIEYGDNPVDGPEANGDTNVDVDVDVDVDVYVKVDINIDPAGKTITTEADDYTVGSAPAIKENVNGDPNVTTMVDGVAKPAEIERTYYIKDSSAADGWRALSSEELSDGAPVHAGTYKVVSNATASVSGSVTEAYKAGEDTFTIKPKAVSLDDLLADAMSGTSLEELGGAVLPGTTDDSGSGSTGTDAPGGDDPSGDDPAGDEPGADDPNGPDAPATGPSKPSGLQLGAFGKVYDGTDSFDTSRLSLEGYALPGADVRFVCDGDAAYDNGGAVGERTLTLHGVHLEGADAADYALRGLTGTDYAVKAMVYPRELEVTARSSVTFGLAGQPLVDAAGDAAVLSSNEDVHDNPEASWDVNMLAPVDATRVEDGIESILGEATLTCTRDIDGVALNVDAPEEGLYTVRVAFANVNGTPAAPEAPETEATLATVMALGDALTVTDLGGGYYDLGNYLLHLVDGKVLVTDDPKTDNRLGEAGEVVVDDVISQEPDPAAPAMGPEDVVKLIGERYGDKVPEGVTPKVVITKDGVPVDSIDPTAEGEYVVVATYPDPEGGPDKIVRLTYDITETPTPDDSKWPGDNGWEIDDKNKPVELDPNGGPMDKPAIADDIDDRYGDREEFPSEGELTDMRITHIAPDGAQRTVDVIDPKVPGTYIVDAEYTMPDGTKRYVRTSYEVPVTGQDGTAGGTSGGTLPGPDGSATGGTTGGASGGTSGGIVGAATGAVQSALRLAQTGDGLPLLVLGVVAIAAGAIAGGMALKRRRDQDE